MNKFLDMVADLPPYLSDTPQGAMAVQEPLRRIAARGNKEILSVQQLRKAAGAFCLSGLMAFGISFETGSDTLRRGGLEIAAMGAAVLVANNEKLTTEEAVVANVRRKAVADAVQFDLAIPDWVISVESIQREPGAYPASEDCESQDKSRG